MSNQIKGLLYFYGTNIRHSIIVFWSILLGVLVVTLTAAYILKDGDGIMTMTLTGPIYVYFGIFGFLIVKAWIPFMIKIGATRKNILMSAGMFFTGLAIAFSTIASLLQKVGNMFAKQIGLDTIFLHLSHFFTDTWYTRILIDSTICLFLFSLLFAISLLFYKYGLAIGGIVMGSIFVTMIIGLSQGWLINFILDILTDVNLLFFWQLALVALVIYGLSWFFMRRITIVKAR